MRNPLPLRPTPTQEVHLPRAPLARVIAQTRFPPILAIRNPDKVAVFQEEIRESYPHLSQEQVHRIELGGQTPNVSQGLIWRLADREKDAPWRVSLGVDFVALETSSYVSRADFLDRLGTVLSALEGTFNPASANRLGLRYIDRLTGAAFDQVHQLIRPGVLGLIRSSEEPEAELGASAIHLMTDAQFLVQDGARIQARWGQLPANATHDPDALEAIDGPSWVLDLDMFTTEPRDFALETLLTAATDFAEYLYWLFRQMVKVEFLTFHGGEP